MPPESHKDTKLFASHPIAIAITVAVILFLIGGFIVLRRSGRAVTTASGSWGGAATTLQDPTASTPYLDSVNIPAPQTGASPIVLSPLSSTSTPQIPATPVEQSFELFLSGFTGPSNAPATTANDTSATAEIFSSYLYAPRGLLNASRGKARTVSQESLYQYGNAAGSIIKAFETNNTDMLTKLDGYFADRKSDAGIRDLQSVARELENLGAALRAIDEIPEEARVAHANLGESYERLGTQLASWSENESDKSFLAGITTYTQTADSLARSFVELVTMFSLSNVSFASHEGGSAFMFSAGGGF